MVSHFRKIFINFQDFLIDQFLDFIVLGQVGKSSIGYPVVLGVFCNIVFVNQYQGGQKFAAVADDDGILDISAEFQFILNKGRGNIFFLRP